MFFLHFCQIQPLFGEMQGGNAAMNVGELNFIIIQFLTLQAHYFCNSPIPIYSILMKAKKKYFVLLNNKRIADFGLKCPALSTL